MKPKFLSFLLLYGMVFVWAIGSGCLAETRMSLPNRMALIIGNSNYFHISDLRTPAADSEAIAAQFQKLGYETVLLQNLTKRTLLIALAELQIRAVNSDQVVVYYAGHGVQQDGESYLIPVDARLSEGLRGVELIPMRVVIRAISDKPRQKIVFFDACRDGVVSGDFPVNDNNWAHAGLFVLYSTQPGAVASDGTKYLGPFAGATVQALEGRPLPIEEFAKRVRLDVIRETGGVQIPWSQSSLLRPALLGSGDSYRE